MAAKRTRDETLLKNVETLLGERQDLSNSLKASILSSIEKQIQSENEIQNDEIHSVKLVQIPSLGEFGQLLDIVSPQSAKDLVWTQEDLVLLNISKNVTIVFFDDDSSKDEANATDKEDREKEKEEKEREKNQEAKENANTKEMKKQKKKLRLGKLVFQESEDSNGNDNVIAMAGNTLSMGNFDEFNCLLIGCCIAMAKSSENNDGTTFLDGIFTNIQPFFGKAWTRKDISFAKEEINSILALLIDVLNFSNGSNGSDGSKSQSLDDESLMIRLAMILCASSENITQLSFVKDYIEKKQSGKENIRNKTAKKTKKSNDNGDDNDVVVTAGVEKKNEKEDDSTTIESVKSNILKMKNVMDKSLIKMMIYQVGCFIDLYNLVKRQGKQQQQLNGSIISKFITYFYFFENVGSNNNGDKRRKKSNFLLSMKHGINGDNLLSIARESNDDGNLYKALSKYVESNEVLNDKFRDYGTYFNERSTSLRTELSQVEHFVFIFLFF